MNLIFKEYLEFLQEKGIDTEKCNLKEGYYWLDNQIVKAYDKQGTLHKVLRVLVNDNLDMTIKTVYKNKPFEIESWIETIERNKEQLKALEANSQLLIRNSIAKYKESAPKILSSGGKDSSVTAYLVNQVAKDTDIIFNNTTLDCADTYLHIKEQEHVQIINPKEGFYQWRDRIQFVGNRISRACCTLFKEGAMIKALGKNDKYLFFMGMRNQESKNRSSYVDEWKNEKWGSRDWNAVLPIRKWSEEEIWLYILWKGISINPKYKKGYARVGCAVACPYYAKSSWALDKYWYSFQYNRWRSILKQDFRNNHKALIMNCTEEEYISKAWNGGVFREEPTEEVIKEFADSNGLDLEVARKYFCHTCEVCGKRVKSKEVLSMNMKFLSRNTNKFYCKSDLKDVISDISNTEFTDENWDEYVKKFKLQGCSLF